MICFKEIENEFLLQIQSSVKQHNLDFMQTKSYDIDWYTRHIHGLLPFVESLNITSIDSIYCMFVNSNDKSKCHVDQSDKVDRQWAINIPIENTKNTVMNWYSAATCIEIFESKKYGNYPVFSEDIKHKIASLELASTCFVRTDIPHVVVSKNNMRRVILSITVNDNVNNFWSNFLPALALDKNYLSVGNQYNFSS